MIYSFEPVVDKCCRILILGTMPGVQSLEKQQYYGNRQNTFWRILYSLFDGQPEQQYKRRKEFLLEHHIALWDVLCSCDREGSSDSEIRNPIPNDFEALFQEYPNIEKIFFNGSEAERLFKRYVGKKAAFRLPEHSVLPSTSPANTMKYEDKLARWLTLKQDLKQPGKSSDENCR